MRASFPRTAYHWLLALLASTASAQDADKILKLAPPYPELPPTFWEQHGSVIIVSGLALLAIVGLAIWLGLRKQPIAILPPDVQARNELKALQTLPEDGPVLSQASQTIRRYFISAFGLTPGEFTTGEFFSLTSGSPEIGAELSAVVAEFLRYCDARKFSASPVTPSGAVAQALELVERSEAHRRRASPTNP